MGTGLLRRGGQTYFVVGEPIVSFEEPRYLHLVFSPISGSFGKKSVVGPYRIRGTSLMMTAKPFGFYVVLKGEVVARFYDMDLIGWWSEAGDNSPQPTVS